MPAGPFSEAVRRVSLVAERGSAVRLSFGAGQVTIEAETQGRARARENGPGGVRGPEPVIAFSPHFLLDGIIAAGRQRRRARTIPRRARPRCAACRRRPPAGRRAGQAGAGGAGDDRAVPGQPSPPGPPAPRPAQLPASRRRASRLRSAGPEHRPRTPWPARLDPPGVQQPHPARGHHRRPGARAGPTEAGTAGTAPAGPASRGRHPPRRTSATWWSPCARPAAVAGPLKPGAPRASRTRARGASRLYPPRPPCAPGPTRPGLRAAAGVRADG